MKELATGGNKMSVINIYVNDENKVNVKDDTQIIKIKGAQSQNSSLQSDISISFIMPSPKAGTVTVNIAQAVEETKKGKIEFRLDKTGNIHALVGKLSFDNAKLVENIDALMKAIEENKPTGVKGKLVKKVVVATTMSPGVQVEY